MPLIPSPRIFCVFTRHERLAALLLSAAAFGASSQAQALSPENSAMTPQTLTQDEIHFLMGDHAPQNRPASLVYLSQQEMSEAEGKIGLGGMIIGGISTAAGYIGYTAVSGEGTLRGFLGTTAAGALAGFFGPGGHIVANSIAGSQIGFYTGMAGGLIDRSMNPCNSFSAVSVEKERELCP